MKQAYMYRGAGDTHTEDVQAHRSFSALLVGEVIPGELMDRCTEKTVVHRLDLKIWIHVNHDAKILVQ